MNRIVLGIYDGPSGGAALARDGELLAVADEDRLLRRHGVSGLPRTSVQTVLRLAGVPPETISAVAVATREATDPEGAGDERLPFLYRVGTSLPSPPAFGRKLRDSYAKARRRRLDEALRSEFGIACRVTFLEHHLGHALGAVAAAGARDCLVITMDCGTDGAWVQVASFDAGHPTTLARQPGSRSLLRFLGTICDALGIRDGLDRFARLQVLAERGRPGSVERLAPWVDWKGGRIRLDSSLVRPDGVMSGLLRTARREDVAASALRFAGDCAARFCAHWLRESGRRRLVLAGDLFELPTVVRVVRDVPELADAFVPGAPGDSSLAIGCACAGCLPNVLDPPAPLPETSLASPFLGAAFDDESIEHTLRFEGREFQSSERITRDVGRVLAEGRSLARFGGRGEIGHVGLGNRTLLRNPASGLERGRLGFLVKRGAYHAVVPEELVDDWFDTGGLTPAHLRHAPGLLPPRPEFVAACPELVRSDHLVCVQTVSDGTGGELREILRELETWIGLPLLAAAPYRLPDEPLVSSPRDALRVLHQLGADFAAIGSYLVANSDRPPSGITEAEVPDQARG